MDIESVQALRDNLITSQQFCEDMRARYCFLEHDKQEAFWKGQAQGLGHALTLLKRFAPMLAWCEMEA